MIGYWVAGIETLKSTVLVHKELWFQQDGAICHIARATIDLLKDTFGDRLISRFGPVNWPPRSCGGRGSRVSLVYADKPQTLDHLEDTIRRVIADIRPQMLEKVIENWTSRLDYIRASRGSHMPEILFKILLVTAMIYRNFFYSLSRFQNGWDKIKDDSRLEAWCLVRRPGVPAGEVPDVELRLRCPSISVGRPARGRRLPVLVAGTPFDGAIFQQDNARPHTAIVAQDFLRHFQTLAWQARSPDLSPVEHVWDQLKRQMPSCHSVHDLELAVQDLWAHLPQDNIRCLINSMPDRVAACIAAGGGPTCY
ncbi:transposable element Tcb2 transposase [Trichonephila clavipes]|nr:transposable element Tcb2 transposase [Trichonephila clavipes]